MDNDNICFSVFFVIVGCIITCICVHIREKYDLNHYKANDSNFAGCNFDQFHAKLEEHCTGISRDLLLASMDEFLGLGIRCKID